MPSKKKTIKALPKKVDMKLEKTTIMLRHNFSEPELQEKAQSLGEAIQKMASIAEELASIKKDYGKQITSKQSEINKLSHNITQKYEMRNMPCFLYKNFSAKERQYMDHAGVILKTEPLTSSDYQLAIDASGDSDETEA